MRDATLMSLMLLLTITAPVMATTYYVNGTTGNDDWDGTSPTYEGGIVGPKATIQAGINVSVNGDTVIVADGTYVGKNLDFGGRVITLKSENGPDNCIIDCQGQSNRTVFYFHSGEDSNSVVEGFTITNGRGILVQTSGFNWADYGGGIYCKNSSPTIRNNIITENSVGHSDDYDHRGGGIYCENSSAHILNNVISHNSANEQGDGGGIYCINSSPKILNNVISDCSTSSGHGNGGAIYCESSSPEIINNIIQRNSLYWGDGAGICCVSNSNPLIFSNLITENNIDWIGMGGGIYCDQSSPQIINNIISENVVDLDEGGGIGVWRGCNSLILNNLIINNLAYDAGGGIYFFCLSHPMIANCTIVGNSCSSPTDAKGIAIYSGRSCDTSIANSIIWENKNPYGEEIYVADSSYPSTLRISYSDIQGGQTAVYVEPGCNLIWGEGNININPIFVDFDVKNYHLSSESPCINAGDTSGDYFGQTDIDGQLRVMNGNVDIGADEHPSVITLHRSGSSVNLWQEADPYFSLVDSIYDGGIIFGHWFASTEVEYHFYLPKPIKLIGQLEKIQVEIDGSNRFYSFPQAYIGTDSNNISLWTGSAEYTATGEGARDLLVDANNYNPCDTIGSVLTVQIDASNIDDRYDCNSITVTYEYSASYSGLQNFHVAYSASRYFKEYKDEVILDTETLWNSNINEYRFFQGINQAVGFAQNLSGIDAPLPQALQSFSKSLKNLWSIVDLINESFDYFNFLLQYNGPPKEDIADALDNASISFYAFAEKYQSLAFDGISEDEAQDLSDAIDDANDKLHILKNLIYDGTIYSVSGELFRVYDQMDGNSPGSATAEGLLHSLRPLLWFDFDHDDPQIPPPRTDSYLLELIADLETQAEQFVTIQVGISPDDKGFYFTVDGNDYTTTQPFVWLNGASHTLDAPATQTHDGNVYEFDSWSDGGAPGHSISPTSDETYIVSYTVDIVPPTPNLMTWDVEPNAISATSITMTATQANDDSGVEYYFEETTGNLGGSDSGWQDSLVYTDTDLQPGTSYTYTVKARDKSPNYNETAPSPPKSATTPLLYYPQDMPHTETFNAGLPDGNQGWEYYSSDSGGRIEIVNGRLRMDRTPSGTYTLNEAILHINLEGQSNVVLAFFQSESGDEQELLPATFTDHENGDGVSVSNDGTTWYQVVNASELDVGTGGQVFSVNLDDVGIAYSSDFRIKFQQYDNYPWSSDGREFDDIWVHLYDTDGDGVSDEKEVMWGLNPDSNDTDGDGLSDGFEVCYDGDCDNYNPYDPGPGTGTDLNADSNDTDDDGLEDYTEINSYGTSPVSKDTDADEMPDGYEVTFGLNPVVDDADADADFDGFSNIFEYYRDTFPNDGNSLPTPIVVNVLSDAESIQQAIDSFPPVFMAGDSVVVYSGRYYENINFNGKNITVTSLDPNDPKIVEVTIIDGSQNGSVITFNNGEDANCILTGFTITNGNANNGGGILCSTGSSPSIIRNRITQNSADMGGGISCWNSTAEISNNIIADNSAYYSGGGIECYSSSLLIANNVISDNSASNENGGGISCWSCSPIITNNTIIGNYADDNGGGVFCYDANASISDCNISGNWAGENGAGVYCENGEPNIIKSVISGCFASFGGAIYSTTSSPKIANNEIFDNVATYGGGGIFCYSGAPLINNNWISYNYHSGMYIYESSPTICGNLIAGNEGFLSGGIACDANSTVIIKNNTIVENWGQESGGIGLDVGSSATIANCIIWDNFTDANENQISLFYDEYFAKPTVLDINYSDVEHGEEKIFLEDSNCILTWGTGNISTDPCFIETGLWDSNDIWWEGDYHLLPGSSCIDAGDNNSVPVDTVDLDGDGNTAEPLPWDLDGTPRLADGGCNGTEVVDMGAYELAWSYIGDFDGECDVDFKDFAILALAWLTEDGEAGYNPVCDISIPADNYIDLRDLGILCRHWLWRGG